MGTFIPRLSREFLTKYRAVVPHLQNKYSPSTYGFIAAVTQTRSVHQKILHREVVNRSRKQQLQQVHKKEQQHEKQARTVTHTETVVTTPTNYDDMPEPNLTNPYAQPFKKCIICEHNIELEYKNIRLLSQFVSPHTGMIYGRQYTGLCQYMQRRVSTLIKRARYFGLLPYRNKDPRFLDDPKIFDPFAPKRNVNN